MRIGYDSLITPLGKTNWRNQGQLFGIKIHDRLNHLYTLGKSGSGKTSLMLNMAFSDMKQGFGLLFIDPHSDASMALLSNIPEDRVNDVIYFNPGDIDFPLAFNPLQNVHPEFHYLVTAGLLSTFKNIWPANFGPRLEHILRNTLLTLLECGDATLLDIQPLLTNSYYRDHVISRIRNKHLLAFWTLEFEKYSSALRAEAIAPILNKVGIFSSSGILRNIVGRKHSSFTMESAMKTGKIIIANLSKGSLGEDVSAIIGSILVTATQMSALGRAKLPPEKREPFFLFVDECQNFITDTFTSILSESRKFKLGLCLANQYLGQLKPEIRSAIFGNVGSLIIFKIGSEDSKQLATEFHPVFNEIDLINLPRYSMYLKLMIDGTCSQPFSADSLPVKEPVQSSQQKVIAASRMQFAINKSAIEEEIIERYDISESETPHQRNLFTS